MPAVSVSDITVLPRVNEAPNARARTVKSISTAPQGFEGEGFPVRRAFAGVDLAELDPFLHLRRSNSKLQVVECSTNLSFNKGELRCLL